MPTIPKLFDVFADERLVEVLRRLDAEEITDADSHETVSGKVKEQVETVSIHVNQRRPYAIACAQPQNRLIEARGNDHFVHHAQADLEKTRAEHFQVFLSWNDSVQVFVESPAPVNRARRDCREV